ncbi:MAG TPA: hypothetical protein VIN09_10805 [Chloroflexota bacterium]
MVVVSPRVRPLLGQGVFRSLRAWSASSEIAERRTDEYLHRVRSIVAEAIRLHDAWEEERRTREEWQAIANAAAIYRWRLHRSLAKLARLRPPSHMLRHHHRWCRTLFAVCRAAQRLSHAYRAHHLGLLCDAANALDDAWYALLDDLARAISARRRRGR